MISRERTWALVWLFFGVGLIGVFTAAIVNSALASPDTYVLTELELAAVKVLVLIGFLDTTIGIIRSAVKLLKDADHDD